MGAAVLRRPLSLSQPCPLCRLRALAPGCHVRVHDDLSPSCRACWEHAYFSPRTLLRRLEGVARQRN